MTAGIGTPGGENRSLANVAAPGADHGVLQLERVDSGSDGSCNRPCLSLIDGANPRNEAERVRRPIVPKAPAEIEIDDNVGT